MNTSFSSFAVVNTYGAFGSVGRVRNEVIVQARTVVLLQALLPTGGLAHYGSMDA